MSTPALHTQLRATADILDRLEALGGWQWSPAQSVRDAMLALEAAPTITVKPLVWVAWPDGLQWRAELGSGRYYHIRLDNHGNHTVSTESDEMEDPLYSVADWVHPTLAAAQAAAQAEWDAFIRAAVEVTP